MKKQRNYRRRPEDLCPDCGKSRRLSVKHAADELINNLGSQGRDVNLASSLSRAQKLLLWRPPLADKYGLLCGQLSQSLHTYHLAVPDGIEDSVSLSFYWYDEVILERSRNYRISISCKQVDQRCEILASGPAVSGWRECIGKPKTS